VKLNKNQKLKSLDISISSYLTDLFNQKSNNRHTNLFKE